MKKSNDCVSWAGIEISQPGQLSGGRGAFWIWKYQRHFPLTILWSTAKEKKCVCLTMCKKQKQTAAQLVSAVSVEGCQHTNVQTNRRLCDDTTDYPTTPDKSRWGQVFDRNSAHYFHGLSGVCGHCGDKWRHGNKRLKVNVHNVQTNHIPLHWTHLCSV